MKHKIEKTETEETNHIEIQDLVMKARGTSIKEPRTENLDLNVGNWPDQGTLILGFKKGSFVTFQVTIADGLMSFQRHVHRPNHDHDSDQTLFRNSKGELFWSSDPPDSEEGEVVFTIVFGHVIDSAP